MSMNTQRVQISAKAAYPQAPLSLLMELHAKILQLAMVKLNNLWIQIVMRISIKLECFVDTETSRPSNKFHRNLLTS